MSRGWIGVDLDGTLAHEHPEGYAPGRIGEPCQKMVDRVQAVIDDDVYDVKIMTARASVLDRTFEDCILEHEAIEAFCEQCFGRRLPITHEKDYLMVELWDDRAVQIDQDTGDPVAGSRSRVAHIMYPGDVQGAEGVYLLIDDDGAARWAGLIDEHDRLAFRRGWLNIYDVSGPIPIEYDGEDSMGDDVWRSVTPPGAS